MTVDVSAQVAHLYRRAGFGASSPEIAAAAKTGYASAVATLVNGLSGPDQGADAIAAPSDIVDPATVDLSQLKSDLPAKHALGVSLRAGKIELTQWWLDRMVATTSPLNEKLTFLLHGHFPTAISKVRFPSYMYGQNQLFRTMGSSSFDTLTQAVSTDPAMLIWLDAGTDKAADPNENFARELMERFTMGIGNYSESDVKAAATSFTGWRLDRKTGSMVINPRQHDATPQTFLGTSGVSSGQQVIDLVTHSAASAKYVPAALWSHLAYPVLPSDSVVADLSPDYAADLNVANLLRAIFMHPSFVSAAATGGLIKQPTEYVVGSLRTFGVTTATFGLPQVLGSLADMGQVLFDPPSVGGWSQNEYWLSTSAALARWQFAHRLTAVADLSAVADEPAASRVETAAAFLGLTGWSSATTTALRRAAGNPPMLMTLALVTPEYVSN
jgi:uncharacterized protein (DUF1800 family)